MSCEITQDIDENPLSIQQKEAQKIKIRQIIDYQKSLYFSSSSSSSSSSSASSSTSSSSLLGLMREGSAPLRRLFAMEHTSLEKYFKEYSASPLIRPIDLWGDDDGEAHDDPWAGFKQNRGGGWRASSRGSSSNGGNIDHGERMKNLKRRRLYRAKSYKRLPRISFWRCGKFRFRFRLRLILRLRILIRRKLVF